MRQQDANLSGCKPKPTAHYKQLKGQVGDLLGSSVLRLLGKEGTRAPDCSFTFNILFSPEDKLFCKIYDEVMLTGETIASIKIKAVETTRRSASTA